MRSIPVDIPPEMADIFRGLALYDNGTITLAYQVPIVIRQLVIGDRRQWAAFGGVSVEPGTRVTFEARAAADER